LGKKRDVFEIIDGDKVWKSLQSKKELPPDSSELMRRRDHSIPTAMRVA